MSRLSKPAQIVMPSAVENRGVGTAAKADPAAQLLTPKQLATMIPVQALRGRPKSASARQRVSVRYGAAVLEYFKLAGEGWQSHRDGFLPEHVIRHPRRTRVEAELRAGRRPCRRWSAEHGDGPHVVNRRKAENMKPDATRKRLAAAAAEREAIIAAAPGNDRMPIRGRGAKLANAAVVKRAAYAAVRAALPDKRSRGQRDPQHCHPKFRPGMPMEERPYSDTGANLLHAADTPAVLLLRPR